MPDSDLLEMLQTSNEVSMLTAIHDMLQTLICSSEKLFTKFEENVAVTINRLDNMVKVLTSIESKTVLISTV